METVKFPVGFARVFGRPPSAACARRLRATWQSALAVVCTLASLMASGCALRGLPGATATAAALPTPVPGCRSNVCVHRAHVRRTDEVLLFDFELRDAENQVMLGTEPRFNAMVSLGVFRAEDGEVLWGAMIPIPICYAGTDIPWAEGRLTAICGTGVPIAKMRSTPEDGDLLRVELIEYDFRQLFLYPPASDG